QFDVIKPATNKKGNRLFTKGDVDNIKKIYHLVKEKGFTLKGAKVELKTEKHKQPGLLEAMKPAEHVSYSAPVEQELFSSGNDYVEKIAVMNSLQKIRKSLVDIQGQLAQLEVQ